jgi:hypothetical protein
MRATHLIGLGAVVTVLSACVSPEALRAQDQQRCAGFGFSPGTDAFATA